MSLSLRTRPALFDAGPAPLSDFVSAGPDVPDLAKAVDLDDFEGWADRPDVRTPLLIDVQTPRVREPMRKLWAVAVAMPMLVAPAVSRAEAPPAAATSPSAATSPAPPDSPPAAEPAPETAPPSDPPAPPGPPSQVETTPPPRPQPIAIRDDLSLTGRTLWDGLRNIDVRLELADGTVLAGAIIQQTDDTLLLAVDGYAEPFAVPKNEVRGVSLQRVALGDPAPTGPRPKRGTGLLAGGIALVVVGALGLVGVGVANSPSVLVYYGVPAGAAVGAGIPMIAIGAKRRQDYREAQRKLGRVQPSGYVTRRGAGASLRLRF